MKAFISGCTGQDGHFLSELLLSKGYTVYGLVRRNAQSAVIPKGVIAVPGDVTDPQVVQVVENIFPSEIYHLAAMSHVWESFKVPRTTFEINALGTLNMLEAVKKVRARFYNASTSELFGSTPPPQNEKTPFHPRSPYGVAKMAAYWLTVNYREAYGIHASNGILFNHECVTEQTPIIIYKNGDVDVVRFPDIVAVLKNGRNPQRYELPDTLIWDGSKWATILAVTATRRRKNDREHTIKNIHARAGILATTNHHTMIKENGVECKTSDLADKDELLLSYSMPENNGWNVLSTSMARFVGCMIADGHITEKGNGQFTKNNDELRSEVSSLWCQLFSGNYREDSCESGFKKGNIVKRTNLSGNVQALKWLRSEIYTKDGLKKIPKFILNASTEIQQNFFEAYYACDGLKQGNGDSFKTNSSVLAQGLIYVLSCLDRTVSTYLEERDEKEYYAINIFRDGKKGDHLKKNPNEIRKITESKKHSEWVFDIETDSKKFMAGVGYIITHNSPMRGSDFVTQKVAQGVADIQAGLTDNIVLGNLDAIRDWGHAKDFVKGMWLMLQQDEPDDYVLATGESHSVRDLLDHAFGMIGINDWKNYITTDPKYTRPTEVETLIGDASKAKRILGWKPEYSFKEIITEMVNARCGEY